jgi:ABC-type sugar transport system substrate-binding protein
MKKISVVVLLVALTVSGVFASGQQDAASAANRDDGVIKIGYSVLDLSNPFFVARMEGARVKAKELGVILLENDAKSDASIQISAMETWIAQGVDGMVVTSVDSNALVSVMEQANEAGIPVFGAINIIEGQASGSTIDEYGFGKQGGLLAGEWIKEKLNGEAEYAIIDYPEIKQVILRANGINDGILEISPNARLVAQQSAATPNDGMTVAEAILQAHPNVKVIQCINDAGAIGVYEAVKAAGKDTDDFYIGGLDATNEACDKIKENDIFRATVDMAPYANAQKDIEIMLKLINGETVEPIVIPTVPVTMDNIDQY